MYSDIYDSIEVKAHFIDGILLTDAARVADSQEFYFENTEQLQIYGAFPRVVTLLFNLQKLENPAPRYDHGAS
jgi:hypothetical protein